MSRRVLLIAVPSLLIAAIGYGVVRYFARPAAPTGPREIAEGAYGATSSSPSSSKSRHEVDSFTLWAGQGPDVRAVIDGLMMRMDPRDPAKPSRQTETIDLNSDFSMQRLRYELENAGPGDGALDCAVKLLSLDCVSTIAGSNGKGSIQATGGYATQFGAETALLDFPWFFTTLVAHGKRNAAGNTQLGAITLNFDGQTPDSLIMGRVLDAKVDYLGPETITVMDRPIKAHKFHVTGGHSRDLPDLESTVWVSERGLLLALDWLDGRWELTRFLQREPLISELPVEDDLSMAIRHSGQFERKQKIRVQHAVSLDIGSRQEAMYQTLHDFGVIQIEEDRAIKTEGHRTWRVTITDAGKQVSDWTEGAVVWDFPVADEKIVGIQPVKPPDRHGMALYAVTYRWELNALGERIKDTLPQQSLISSQALPAQVGMRLQKNEWKVDTVQRPTESRLAGQ